ncbi:hypothetical protein D3C78_828260 [compost metagenome]
MVVLIGQGRVLHDLQRFFVAARMNQRPGVRNTQTRMLLANSLGNSRQPAHHQAGVAALHQLVDVSRQLAGGLVDIVGGEQMLQCLHPAVGGKIPARRGMVRLPIPIRVL